MYIIRLSVAFYFILLVYSNSISCAENNYMHPIGCTEDNGRYIFELMRKHDNESLFEFVSSKIKECPDDIDLRSLRSMIFINKKMYKDALKDIDYILSKSPLDQGILIEKCLLNESIAPNNNRESHLLCYKNVSESIKSTNNDKSLFENDGIAYVLAVSMAEIPEAETIRKQYLDFLDTIAHDPSSIKYQEEKALVDLGRQFFLHFDRKKFLYPPP